ncbi:MAG: divergent PAP2 family protein [Chloroflexi bacterium]|nr:divergent PAP2 family protein [Chloroflexota bacterium]
MIHGNILANRVLIAGLIAWILAQGLKLPLEYLQTRRWNWALLISTGGMPSSHSALVVSTALAIGLFVGFDSPLFALAVAIAMVVTYDATNIRRQAGMHAQKINLLINELFSGQPISEERLKEVLGHTPLEVAGGVILGVAVALITWFFIK